MKIFMAHWYYKKRKMGENQPEWTVGNWNDSIRSGKWHVHHITYFRNQTPTFTCSHSDKCIGMKHSHTYSTTYTTECKQTSTLLTIKLLQLGLNVPLGANARVHSIHIYHALIYYHCNIPSVVTWAVLWFFTNLLINVPTIDGTCMTSNKKHFIIFFILQLSKGQIQTLISVYCTQMLIYIKAIICYWWNNYSYFELQSTCSNLILN